MNFGKEINTEKTYKVGTITRNYKGAAKTCVVRLAGMEIFYNLCMDMVDIKCE